MKIINKIVLAAVTTVAVAAPLAVTGTAHANPGSPGCVTWTEFRSIHKGDSRTRVERVFGTRGHITGVYGSGVVNRQYRTCGSMSFAGITYVYDRVNYKLGS